MRLASFRKTYGFAHPNLGPVCAVFTTLPLRIIFACKAADAFGGATLRPPPFSSMNSDASSFRASQQLASTRSNQKNSRHFIIMTGAVILQKMQPVRVVPSYSSNGFVGFAAANCSTGVAPFNEGAGDSARPAICFIAFI